MTQQNEKTFESLILGHAEHRNLHQVMEDFLDTSITTLSYACVHNTLPELNYLDLNIVARYADDSFYAVFLELLKQLSNEITLRQQQEQNPDILGEFYERHLADPELPLFPTWQDLQVYGRSGLEMLDGRKVLDRSCGSGRRIMATTEEIGLSYMYLGMDTHLNLLLVKMAALNLFMGSNGKGEVACFMDDDPERFIVAYQYSQYPLFLKQISLPEQSMVWRTLKRQ